MPDNKQTNKPGPLNESEKKTFNSGKDKPKVNVSQVQPPPPPKPREEKK